MKRFEYRGTAHLLTEDGGYADSALVLEEKLAFGQIHGVMDLLRGPAGRGATLSEILQEEFGIEDEKQFDISLVIEIDEKAR